MRISFIIYFCAVFCHPCFSEDAPPVSVIDKDGNTIVIGTFAGKRLSLHPSFPNHDTTGQSSDIYVIKSDKNAHLKWVFTAGGGGYDYCEAVTTDRDGNIYIAGQFRSPVFGIGSYRFTNASDDGTNADIFLAKLDPLGKLV